MIALFSQAICTSFSTFFLENSSFFTGVVSFFLNEIIYFVMTQVINVFLII